MFQGVLFYTPNLEVLLKVIHRGTPRMTLSAVMPLRIFVPSVKMRLHKAELGGI